MNALLKAGKTMLNALAFANADNYSEFHKQLRQVDEKSAPRSVQPRCQLVYSSDQPAALAPRIQRVSQSLPNS